MRAMSDEVKSDQAGGASGQIPAPVGNAGFGVRSGFRQSTGACARAIAKDTSIDITFDEKADEVSGMVLPAIPDDATVLERLQTRGRSDAIALHKQHHNASTHAKYQPSTDTSQRLHAMAEQTRVELIGSNEFEGVGRNLDAALDGRYQLLLDTIAKPAIPLADAAKEPRLGIDHALTLFLREKLSVRELPSSAKEAMSDWREWLESDVSEKFDAANFDLNDQASFARSLGQLLRSLDIDDGEAADNPDDFSDENQTPEESQSPIRNG